jgi:hypothetical protein
MMGAPLKIWGPSPQGPGLLYGASPGSGHQVTSHKIFSERIFKGCPFCTLAGGIFLFRAPILSRELTFPAGDVRLKIFLEIF